MQNVILNLGPRDGGRMVVAACVAALLVACGDGTAATNLSDATDSALDSIVTGDIRTSNDGDVTPGAAADVVPDDVPVDVAPQPDLVSTEDIQAREEPDTSEPDTSEPDASEPDASEPDTSEPDMSEPDPCDPNPCQNGATCALVAGSAQCSCPTNFSGATCEVYDDPCQPSPCINGGTCTVVEAGATCLCPVNYSGTTCEVFDDPLLSEYPEAQFVVRVRAEEIFPNCPRYIHKMQMVERSRFVPKEACETPDAEWKDHFEEILPADQRARRQAKASE